MPIVEGEMIGALRRKLFKHNSLKIVKVGTEDDEFNEEARKIRIINAYVQDECDGAVSIELTNVEQLDAEDATEYAKTNDVDIIWSENMELSEEQAKVMKDVAKVSKDLSGVIDEIESFLVGNGIYWNHELPAWNSDALMRYNTKNGIAQKAADFLANAQQNLNYTAKIIDRIRYLAVKATTAFYAKDTLQFFLQSRRKSRRRDFDRQQTYTIELNYNLTNYYFLMASTFDIIARILNDRYELGIARFNSLGLEKDDFISALRPHNPALADFLENEDTKKWVKWLKRRRNFIAHEAGIRSSPIVEERDPQLTEDELEAIVEQQMDWDYVRRLFPPELYESQRQQVRSLMNYQHNYIEVLDDVMIVETSGNKEIFLPLEAVDYDFEKYSSIVEEILRLLEVDGAMEQREEDGEQQNAEQ